MGADGKLNYKAIAAQICGTAFEAVWMQIDWHTFVAKLTVRLLHSDRGTSAGISSWRHE
jgi:hypothetical protein